MKKIKKKIEWNNLKGRFNLPFRFTSLLFALILFASQNVNAQSIARSTFCGTGATWMTSAGGLTSTFGQCPGCGTLSTAEGALTQGFQQPTSQPCFSAAIDFTEMTDNCGTTYDFTIIGNVDVDEATFSWNFGPSGFPSTSNEVDPQGIAFSTTGIVQMGIVITEGDCEQQLVIAIDVPAVGFAANPLFDEIDCNGGTNGSIGLDLNGGTAPFEYNWSTGDQSEVISGLPAGDYSYTVTDLDGCETSNAVTLAEPASLQAAASVQSETCKGDLDGSIEVTITGGTAPYQLQWNNGASETTLTGLTFGDYLLVVTDANDCEAEFSFAVGQNCELRVEDVVSPNGDGENDNWIVNGLDEFPENEVAIFNRWGQEVWSAKGYNNDWAGTNEDGELLPIGAYFYVLKLNDVEERVLSGAVTLVR
ncbi:MAG: gliding motility-associated C-terminal domain-containing protein [Bacteroidota bacterium]